jgi:hypothetical protein
MAFPSVLCKAFHGIAPVAMATAAVVTTGFGTAAAAQVGPNQSVNFGQALISNSCTLTTSDGSMGVRTNRSLITSDVGEGGNYNGTLAAATITAASNLTSTGFVKVENPTLGGGTGATSAQVRLGTTGAWGSTAQANLGTDGSMSAVPLHVRFSTTSNNGRFANGTYTASATVSCYDGI